MIGIYAIKNLRNGKMYIGQSINISNRINSHIGDLTKNIHVNVELQNDFNKDNTVFVYGIIKECEMYSLDIYEKESILKYDTIKNGYNSVLPIIQQKSLSDFIYEINIDIYEKTTMIKLATAYNFNSASKLINSKPQDIKKCCELKRRTVSNKYITLYQSTSIDNYKKYWKRKDMLQTKEQKSSLWKINSHKHIEMLRNSKKFAILQYDLNMNLIAEYDIITDTPENFNNKYIRKVLSGERNSYAGYIWKYKTYNKKSI